MYLDFGIFNYRLVIHCSSGVCHIQSGIESRESRIDLEYGSPARFYLIGCAGELEERGMGLHDGYHLDGTGRAMLEEAIEIYGYGTGTGFITEISSMSPSIAQCQDLK